MHLLFFFALTQLTEMRGRHSRLQWRVLLAAAESMLFVRLAWLAVAAADADQHHSSVGGVVNALLHSAHPVAIVVLVLAAIVPEVRRTGIVERFVRTLCTLGDCVALYLNSGDLSDDHGQAHCQVIVLLLLFVDVPHLVTVSR